MTIMKQLIENMIFDYLEESYGDDLVESIFEEVSEETWEAIEEAILNELSPELLARYSSAARKSLETAQKKRMKTVPGGAAYDKHTNVIAKRRKGSDAAGARSDARSGNTNPQYMSKADTDDRAERIKKINNLKKLPSAEADFRNLPADDFQKKYRMTKAEWERKNK